VGKELGSVVVVVDEEEQADRILAERVVNMPGSEVGFSRAFNNFRYFRCRKCEHAQLGCLTKQCAANSRGRAIKPNPAPFSSPRMRPALGHSRATDPGRAKFRKER
ncbi:hypothetical protein LTR80_012157, partial [Exophiala xenobiotica]